MDFRNLRPWPQSTRNPLGFGKNRVPGKSKFIADKVTGGMVTTIDPSDLPPGALQIMRNARVRFDKTQRRPGTQLLTPAKPNANPVIGLFYFKKNDGTNFYFRFTPSTIHSRGVGVWTAYAAGAGGVLAGGQYDYPQAAVVLDKFVFAQNGTAVLQELDTGALTYKALGDAPKYKYVTGFANRVVGANLVAATSNPVQVGWSGDANPTVFNPATDETAGSSPLVDSPSDLADYISGIFGFTNVMLVLREQSVWLATRQPSATQPFYFYTAFPGVGCDAPFSAQLAQNSIIWADRRTGTVWEYEPGKSPIPIGRPIENKVFAGLTDEKKFFSAYDAVQNEYILCIPQVSGDSIICWVYNKRSQTWDKDEYEGITVASNADQTVAVTTIDELPGIIEDLTGDIDSLSPSQTITPARAFGRQDGEIIVESLDDNVNTDPSYAASSGAYETELLSKSYTLPTDDVYIAEIRIEVMPRTIGTVTLGYSKDGGNTISTDTKTFTFDGNDIGTSKLIRRVKQVKARRYSWRLVATTGQFDILGYEVHVYKSGESND